MGVGGKGAKEENQVNSVSDFNVPLTAHGQPRQKDIQEMSVAVYNVSR